MWHRGVAFTGAATPADVDGAVVAQRLTDTVFDRVAVGGEVAGTGASRAVVTDSSRRAEGAGDSRACERSGLAERAHDSVAAGRLNAAVATQVGVVIVCIVTFLVTLHHAVATLRGQAVVAATVIVHPIGIIAIFAGVYDSVAAAWQRAVDAAGVGDIAVGVALVAFFAHDAFAGNVGEHLIGITGRRGERGGAVDAAEGDAVPVKGSRGRSCSGTTSKTVAPRHGGRTLKAHALADSVLRGVAVARHIAA